MNQFWPFFLTGFFPCFLVLVGMLVNDRAVRAMRDEMRAGFLDIKNQINHLIDLHIDHAERIVWLETKAGKK